MRLTNYKTKLFFVTALFPLFVHATDAKLTLKPRLCIVSRAHDVCTVDVNIMWRAENSGAVCVVEDKNNKQLQCWEKATFGKLRHKLITDSDQRYWLQWQEQNKELAQAVLKVVNITPEDRRHTRRRRHVWSMF